MSTLIVICIIINKLALSKYPTMKKCLFAVLLLAILIPSCKTKPSAPDANQMIMATKRKSFITGY